MTGFVGEVKVNQIGRDEDEPERPKDSGSFAGESFEYWEFPETYYRYEHQREHSHDDVVCEVDSAGPAFGLLGVEGQFVEGLLH